MSEDLFGIGERGVIRLIAERLGARGMALDVEEDCAVIDVDGTPLALTTDLITGRWHLPQGATAWQVGWFVAAINLSDIASMGARPIGLLTALALPGDTSLKFLEGLQEGLADCLEEHGALLLGGDTKESMELTISATALGSMACERFLTRKGAVPGDLLAVTGGLGRAGAGLYLIEDPERREEGLRLVLGPRPRILEGIALAGIPGVHSCMDVSDGLSTSVHQLSAASGVAFEVDVDKVPIHPVLSGPGPDAGLDALDTALNSGGDYELLFTVSPDAFEEVKAAMARIGTKATAVGRAIDGRENKLIKGHSVTQLEPRGYEHFRGGL